MMEDLEDAKKEKAKKDNKKKKAKNKAKKGEEQARLAKEAEEAEVSSKKEAEVLLESLPAGLPVEPRKEPAGGGRGGTLAGNRRVGGEAHKHFASGRLYRRRQRIACHAHAQAYTCAYPCAHRWHMALRTGQNSKNRAVWRRQARCVYGAAAVHLFHSVAPQT